MPTCPLCRHTRTPRDPLPEWKCPACGVSYAEGFRRTQLGLGPPPAPRKKPTAIKPLLVAAVFIAVLFSGGWLVLREQAQSPRPAAGAVTMSGHIAAARSTQPRVVMYATSWCPYCARARTFLRVNGIRYTELDVEKDPAAREHFQRLGGGVPVITVGEEVVHGFDERALRRALGPWLEGSSG
jgi:glutaredoxin